MAKIAYEGLQMNGASPDVVIAGHGGKAIMFTRDGAYEVDDDGEIICEADSADVAAIRERFASGT